MDSLIINDILKVARNNNLQHDITGALFLGSGFFIQCLEGNETEVYSLYQKIEKDERHTNVQLLDFSPIDSKVFKDWSMAFISSADLYDFKVDNLNTYTVDKIYSILAMLVKNDNDIIPESD